MPRGVLLAAGRSSRFGENKLLHPMADSTPIIITAARTLHEALPHSVVVVDDADSEVARIVSAEGFRIAVNPGAEAGIASSIACGVEAAGGVDGWVIALGDMPNLRAESIARVAAAIASGARLAAPVYKGQRGHPVGFCTEFGPSLCSLQGDQGARSLLQRHSEALVHLPVEDPGTVLDIDTPEDLHKATGFPAREVRSRSRTDTT